MVFAKSVIVSAKATRIKGEVKEEPVLPALPKPFAKQALEARSAQSVCVALLEPAR